MMAMALKRDSLIAGKWNLYLLVINKSESGFYYHFSSYVPYIPNTVNSFGIL